jgi:hypothetical protein
MHLVPLLIACAVGGQPAAEPSKEPLTNESLREINQSFVATHEFEDNEFLYEEKLAEAVEKAKRFVGRPVRIELRVDQVSKERVDVEFFPDQGEEDTQASDRSEPAARFGGGRGREPDLLPQVAFVAADDAEIEFQSSRSRGFGSRGSNNPLPGLGGTNDGGWLAVPKVVPVELARKLRAGDRLVITGTLKTVKPAPSTDYFRRSGRIQLLSVAGIVVANPKAEKAGGKADRATTE